MARNQIKGLTVEIGGDTTNLGKALESVNKKSSDLSAELGEINKLLKFDPDNAELLSQKQKVLADAVTNTSEKLEKLKEAEKQVQKQFERGEVSEEQVRALQREIIATEGKLESYKKQAEEAADGTKELGDKAEESEGALAGLAGGLVSVGKAGVAMGGKVANAAKVGIGAVVAGATAAVGALVASAEATREYRTEMGKLTTAFETVGHRTEIAEESYKRLYGVIGETDQAVEAAQQIALLADSEEDVVQWSDLAAGVVGRFGDALQPETFFEAANETIKLGEATGAYVQLLEGAGYDVDEFNKGLAACTTESEKQAYMLKITDEILGDAADTYRETNAEVIRANDANAAWTATLAEVGASVEPILTDVKMLGASLLGELVPGITGVTDAFRGLVNGEEGSAEAVGEALSNLLSQILNMIVKALPTIADTAISLVGSFIDALFDTAPQILSIAEDILLMLIEGITTGLPAFLSSIKGLLSQILDTVIEMLPAFIETIISLYTALYTTIIEMLPQLVEAGVTLISAILEGIATAIPQITQAIVDTIPKLVDALVTGIPQIIDGAVQLLLAIMDAIPLIIPPLVEALPEIVIAIIDGLLSALPDLIEGAVQFLLAIVQAIPILLQALLPEVPRIVDTIIDGLLDNLPVLIDGAVELLFGILEAIPEIQAAIYEEMPSIVTSIVGALLDLIPELIKAGGQLLAGLVEGMLDFDIGGALKKVGDGIINGFKKAFDIHSPSRVMAGIGELLDEGLAVGIEENAGTPVNALDKLSEDMIEGAEGFNGMTLERRMVHSFNAGGNSTATDGISSKLDRIYQAILSGQVIMLDGKALVGSTANRYDTELGQRRVLAERGAL